MNMNNQVKFQSDTCIGCQLCYKSCFIDVIRWNETDKKPEFKYLEDCVHCNYCEVVCPKNCIEIVPDFKGELFHQSFNQYK